MSIETNNDELVSVLLSFHNARNTLLQAIRSLQWQTYSNWELILLDDGSTDGSVKIVKAFNDPRIRFYQDEVCRGLPFRLNQGVSLARGQYIARMDADDIAYPERLEFQIRFLEKNPEVDLLGTGAIVFDRDGNPLGGMPVKVTHAEICAKPWSGFYLAHPTWMGRRAWFLRHQYDLRCRRAQDYELLLRNYHTSHYACLPEKLIGYRQETLSITKMFKRRFYLLEIASRYAFLHKDLCFMGRAIGVLFAKCSYDLGLFLLGLMPQHRAVQLDLVDIKRWQELWHSVNAENAKCAAL